STRFTAVWYCCGGRPMVGILAHHYGRKGGSDVKRLMQQNRVGEVGDVPGWVLITLMTAGLVVVIWAVAGPALSGVFESAIERVVSV
ncbi:MAG: hypothetical protein ACOYNK_05465, partial [Microbacteriaceae bacterium]